MYYCYYELKGLRYILIFINVSCCFVFMLVGFWNLDWLRGVEWFLSGEGVVIWDILWKIVVVFEIFFEVFFLVFFFLSNLFFNLFCKMSIIC